MNSSNSSNNPFEPSPGMTGMRRMDRRTSTSAASAAASASRQKSCNACVRGKRRCDKTMPRCTRCALKGLDCVYQKMPLAPAMTASATAAPAPPTSAATSHLTPPSTTSPSSSSPSSCPGMMAAMQDLQNDFNMSSWPELGSTSNSSSGHGGAGTSSTPVTATTSPESLVLDPSLNFSLADILGHSGTATMEDGDDGGMHHHLWDLPEFGGGGKADFPAPVPTMPTAFEEMDMGSTEGTTQHQHQHHHDKGLPQQPIRDVALLDNSSCDPSFCLDPMQVHDPRSRIGFIVENLTQMHADFARTRNLPYLHPRLYRSSPPPTILTAYGAAATYAGRTPATKAWALRAVADAATAVHAEGRKLTASAPLADKLARVQALLIVESMRILDGDVGLRHAASKDRHVLLDWIADLSKTLEANEVERHQRCARDHPPKTWDSWVVLESARRTTMMAFAFLCLLCILQSELPDQDLWNDNTWFTTSAHLWNATSSVEFFRAWRDKPRWEIQNCMFRDFWQFGQPEDLDEFSRLMLTGQVGRDAMDHFMAGDVSIPV